MPGFDVGCLSWPAAYFIESQDTILLLHPFEEHGAFFWGEDIEIGYYP